MIFVPGVRLRDMPLVTCPDCALPAYSAARWSTRDECVRCGAALRPPRRGAELLRMEASTLSDPYAAPARRTFDVRSSDR